MAVSGADVVGVISSAADPPSPPAQAAANTAKSIKHPRMPPTRIASRLQGTIIRLDRRGHGAELIAAGFNADIEHCARLDVSTTVPLLHRDGDGRLVLRLYA